MMQVLVALALAAAAIGGEWLARKRFSRSTSWLLVHPAVLVLAVLFLGIEWPKSGGRAMWYLAVLGVVVAAGAYSGLRWFLKDHARRTLEPDHPWVREGAALVVVLPVVEQLLWGWVLAPVLGVLVVAGLFAVKHPVSDGNWRRTPGLAGFWMGISMVMVVDPILSILSHVGLNGAAFWRSKRSGKDEF